MPNSSNKPLSRWQFSLWSLVLLMAIVAIGLAIGRIISWETSIGILAFEAFVWGGEAVLRRLTSRKKRGRG